MAYDEDLANRIRELILTEPHVTEKAMFGGLAFLIGGNMSVSVSREGGLLLRVDPEDSDALLEKPHTHPFVMRSRAMQGWLRVDAEGVRTKRQLERWVARGTAYAQSLPRKRSGQTERPSPEAGPSRAEAVIDTGCEYRPGDPVRVRVVHREHRTSVTDDGAAISRAGRPPGWRQAARRVSEDVVVNIGQHGVVSLPVVRAGPSEEEIIRRIGEASRDFYQELLELQD